MKSLIELLEEVNDEALAVGLMTTEEYIALREARDVLYSPELQLAEYTSAPH